MLYNNYIYIISVRGSSPSYELKGVNGVKLTFHSFYICIPIIYRIYFKKILWRRMEVKLTPLTSLNIWAKTCEHMSAPSHTLNRWKLTWWKLIDEKYCEKKLLYFSPIKSRLIRPRASPLWYWLFLSAIFFETVQNSAPSKKILWLSIDFRDTFFTPSPRRR